MAPNTIIVPHGMQVPGYHKVGQINFSNTTSTFGGGYGYPSSPCHHRRPCGTPGYPMPQPPMGCIPGNPSYARCMMSQPPVCAPQIQRPPIAAPAYASANASAFAAPGFASANASALAAGPGFAGANASAFAGPGFASANASAFVRV